MIYRYDRLNDEQIQRRAHDMPEALFTFRKPMMTIILKVLMLKVRR